MPQLPGERHQPGNAQVIGVILSLMSYEAPGDLHFEANFIQIGMNIHT